MRSNRNPSGPATRSVGGRSAGSERAVASKVSLPSIPMEWLDAGSWRLPSGKALAEFALQAGFLAPLLFGSNGALKAGLKAELTGELGPGRAKQFGKGESR